MNKNRFRRVFSKRHGMLVAVAEDVTSQGKAPGEGNASSSSSPQSAKMGVIATMTAFALAMIDPTDVTISTNPDANYTGGMSGFTPSGNAATVNNQSISNVLSGGTNVTITTASSGTATGNIVQQAGADIVKTSGTDATLTMLANGSIQLNGNITSTANKLNLNLTADMSGNHNGSVTVQGANTNLNGGTLSASGNTVNGSGLAGANAVDLAGNITNVGGGSIKGTANTGVGVTIAPGARLTQSGAGIRTC